MKSSMVKAELRLDNLHPASKALHRFFAAYVANLATLERIENLAALWCQQADNYKDQPEAHNWVPMATAVAATVNLCAKELQNVLAGKEPEPHD